MTPSTHARCLSVCMNDKRKMATARLLAVAAVAGINPLRFLPAVLGRATYLKSNDLQEPCAWMI